MCIHAAPTPIILPIDHGVLGGSKSSALKVLMCFIFSGVELPFEV